MAEPERNPGSPGREALLDWYRPRRRAYPWRRRNPDPYSVLVSEVMLQQTQAVRVARAYVPFLAMFPTVEALAAASRADVVRAWAGLGYNRRAVGLHGAARAIERDNGGRVPSDVAELRRLPGVGPYTAAAVASLAFGVPVATLDTNVRRVIARVDSGMEPDELPLARLRAGAERWLDRGDPTTWNSALMDLGREICRPKPRCGACPLANRCAFRSSGRSDRGSRVRREPFEGSSRQVRGAVVAVLRELRAASRSELAALTGHPGDRVAEAVASLTRDGLLETLRAGRVRLSI